MIEKPLQQKAPLFEAVQAIEASSRRIAVVVDPNGKLVGTLTDGDVRRCLLAGGDLQTPVQNAMNARPLTAQDGSSQSYLFELMQRGNILVIPLVDDAGQFVRLIHLSDMSPSDGLPLASQYAFAVIMAGGQGIRLRPITENIPKPMVDIAGVPLLERQILRIAKAGIKKLYLSVNHMSQVIENHFGDGSGFGLTIRYLREKEKLGTAGALSLLPEKPTAAILVMNGDILTASNFDSLYSFHQNHNAVVTVAAVDHHVQIPYGVINSHGAYVTGIVEKPSQRFLCNAGIYAVSPEALEFVPTNQAFNMTDIIAAVLERGRPISVYPVHEYWSDVGTPADLEQARRLYSENPKML